MLAYMMRTISECRFAEKEVAKVAVERFQGDIGRDRSMASQRSEYDSL